MLEIIEVDAGSAGFAACFAIRLAVFVDEQNVPLSEEQDGFDAQARHFLARLDGQAAGTLRLIATSPAQAKITRVAVVRTARGQGVGEALMRHAEAASGAAIVSLDAQVHARAFYERLGYEMFGEEFMEAGIAHVHMRKFRIGNKPAALNQP